MRNIIATAILLFAAGTIPAAAQTDSTAVCSVPAGYYVEESASPLTVDFKGFEIKVPADALVEEDDRLVVKLSDGTLGASLSVASAKGSDRKRCLRMVSDLASRLHIRDAKVRKVKVNGMQGAIASGILESQQVSVLMLPSKGKELTCIIMNDASRASMAERMIGSLSRK